MKSILFFEIILILLFGFAISANAIEETSQSFTLDGRAYSTADASAPLLDTISTKIQILNQNQTCILYEETQSINTTATNGYFTVQVGSAIGAAKRSGNDSANSMQKVFSNTQASVNGKLVSNGAACTYTPANGDKRYVRMQMTPASDSVLRTISPNMALDSVPSALVAERAETVQGLSAANLLQVNTSGAQALSQANLESIFTTTNFANLTTLLATPPASYIKTGSNGSVGLPSISTGSGNPASGLAAGQIWFDATNGVLKYYDGAVKTLGSGGATSFSNQSANSVFAGPASGGAAAPTFRSLATADMPSSVLLNGGNTATAALNIGTATGSAFDVNLITSGSSKMTVKSSGEVGIGTSSPSKNLDIQGTDSNVGARIMNTNSNSARYPGIEIFNYMGAAGLGSPAVELINNRGTLSSSLPVLSTDVLGKIQFAGAIDNATGYRGSASIVGIARENYSSSASGSAIAFYTTPNGTNTPLERVRIDQNGNVGIGAGTPGFPLVVEGPSGAYRTGINVDTASSTYGPTLSGYTTLDGTSRLFFSGNLIAQDNQNLIFGTSANFYQTYDSTVGAFTFGDGTNPFVALYDQGTKADILFNNGDLKISNIGQLGIGTVSPSAFLNIKAGTAAAGTAPLKLTAGTNLTAAEAGAIEFDGSNLYFTDSVPTRRTIATTTSSTFTGISTIGNAGDITLAPTATTGSVLINSGTPSISTGTGALVVTGGMGITNGLNMGGSFNLTGTGTHTQTYTGTGTGASIAANSLTSGSILDLTSTSTAAAAGNTGLNIAISGANATAGITRTGVKSTVNATGATSTNVGASFSASGATNNYGLLVPSGNVGIGTSTPSTALDIGGGSAFVNTDPLGQQFSTSDKILQIRSPTQSVINLVSDADALGAVLGGVYFGRTQGQGDAHVNLGGIQGIQTMTGNTGTMDLAFLVNTGAYTYETMRLSRSGNVGIGTNNPGGTLHLWGSGTAWGEGTSLIFGDQGQPSNPHIKERGITDSDQLDISAKMGLFFRTRGSSAGAGEDVMTITDVGNVAIGATDTQDILNGANLFSTARPKFEILTGAATGAYSEPIVIRHTEVDPTAVVRQLGLLFKMSSEANTTESNKMGGIVLESPRAFANTPDLHLVTLNEKRLTVGATGNVGIGTTTPSALLDVHKDQADRTSIQLTNASNAPNAHAEVRIYSDVETSGFAIGSYGSGFAMPAWIASKNGLFSNDRPLFFAIDPANEVTFNSRFGPEFVRITGAGDMGIGTATPSTKLEVNGVIKSSTGGFTFPDGTTMTTAGATATGSTSTTDLNFASDSDANGSGAMIFSTAGSERMRIQSNGFIGIGVTNPAVGFQMQGNAYFGDGLRAGGVSLGSYGPWGTVSNAVSTVVGDDLLFYPGNSERMRMKADGKIGIATSTPTAKLQIDNMDTSLDTFRIHTSSGDVFIDGYGNLGIAGMALSWDMNVTHGALSSFSNDTYITSGINSALPYNIILKPSGNGNVGVGTISPNYKLDVSGDIRIASGSKLYVNTTAVCDGAGCTAAPSDVRYKENIRPLENSLQKILEIQGVSYDWKDKSTFGDHHQVGLIAQDLERVYPEVVKTDQATGFKSVMYDKLVAPVIESIKELVGRLNTTNSIVASQAREIASMKAEAERLKQENAAMKAYLCSKDPKATLCNQ